MKTLYKSDLAKLLKVAIEELEQKGIKGGIYYYKKGECSCCYGLNDGFYQIQGNTAGNQGGNSTGRITYEHDKRKAKKLFNLLNDVLRSSPYSVKWSHDISEVMQIVKEI